MNIIIVLYINFDIYVYEVIDYKFYFFVCNFLGFSLVKYLLLRKKWVVSNIIIEELFGNVIFLEFMLVEVNFSLIFIIMGCCIWIDDNNLWIMEGCMVNFVFRLYLSIYSSSINVKVRKKEKIINVRVKVRYMYVSY